MIPSSHDCARVLTWCSSDRLHVCKFRRLCNFAINSLSFGHEDFIDGNLAIDICLLHFCLAHGHNDSLLIEAIQARQSSSPLGKKTEMLVFGLERVVGYGLPLLGNIAPFISAALLALLFGRLVLGLLIVCFGVLFAFVAHFARTRQAEKMLRPWI